MNMNIYDKSFHGSDPLTSRPFSSGHPDGVWVIVIIHCLFIAVPIIGLIASLVMMLFFGGDFQVVLGAMSATAVSVVLFLPVILLLFERSGKVFYVFSFYFVVLSLAAFFSYFLKDDVFPIAVVLLGMQSWAIYYVFRLKQDKLIGDEKNLERS